MSDVTNYECPVCGVIVSSGHVCAMSAIQARIDTLTAERDRLAAIVERVRGIGVSVRECAPRANDGQMELWLAQIAADILTALEES